jgi:hypothetical protein
MTELGASAASSVGSQTLMNALRDSSRCSFVVSVLRPRAYYSLMPLFELPFLGVVAAGRNDHCGLPKTTKVMLSGNILTTGETKTSLIDRHHGMPSIMDSQFEHVSAVFVVPLKAHGNSQSRPNQKNRCNSRDHGYGRYYGDVEFHAAKYIPMPGLFQEQRASTIETE